MELGNGIGLAAEPKCCGCHLEGVTADLHQLLVAEARHVGAYRVEALDGVGLVTRGYWRVGGEHGVGAHGRLGLLNVQTASHVLAKELKARE